MDSMTFEEFKADVFNGIKNYPSCLRKGQAVFNYIDKKYGVAKKVQFIDGVDCFYNDNAIEDFLLKSFHSVLELNNELENVNT